MANFLAKTMPRMQKIAKNIISPKIVNITDFLASKNAGKSPKNRKFAIKHLSLTFDFFHNSPVG